MAEITLSNLECAEARPDGKKSAIRIWDDGGAEVTMRLPVGMQEPEMASHLLADLLAGLADNDAQAVSNAVRPWVMALHAASSADTLSGPAYARIADAMAAEIAS